MAPRQNSTDADDVLEFLDSLPDSTAGKKTSSGKQSKNEKDEDILDFLDELEQTNLKASPKKKHSDVPKKIDAKKNDAHKSDTKVTAKQDTVDERTNVTKETTKPNQENKPDAELKTETSNQENYNEEKLSDPISSISSWWSSSGQATVSNIWSKTTQHATQIKDRIAQEQHELSTKLNTNSFTSKFANANMLSELTTQLTKFVIGDTEEVLRVHVVHDLVNFHNLSYHMESQLDKVLRSQVQGGVRIFVDEWDRPNESSTFSGDSSTRKLNLFQGKPIEADKLCLANLDNAIKLFQHAKEEMKQRRGSNELEAIEDEESRISDVFVGILAVGQQAKNESESIVDSTHAGSFNFTFLLKDVSNDLSLVVRSQGFPIRWVDWLEGTSELKSKGSDKSAEGEIDPSDWVVEWIENGLELAIGVLAQTYVIKRMGI
ncbi:HBR214Wp [Eremothecium sinecaudum]|uniref:HBR214Wp n=1 Tax=Eremothecium sinecaudum TaxID=45286 RepID=A0A109UX46_9SACH|nr:HBR214Wp [Eremothecium sinecaudum]AMD19115.1 HBR214Wp [Eremothecium sinecaudum]